MMVSVLKAVLDIFFNSANASLKNTRTDSGFSIYFQQAQQRLFFISAVAPYKNTRTDI